MKSGDINTAIADKAHKSNNGQAWSTPWYWVAP